MSLRVLVAAVLAGFLALPALSGASGSAPDTPAGLIATASTNGVSLSWQAVDDSHPIGYRVFRRSATGQWGAAVAEVDGTTFEDRAVNPGTTYVYRVTAYDATGGGESSPSREVSATPTSGSGEGYAGGGGSGGPGADAVRVSVGKIG